LVIALLVANRPDPTSQVSKPPQPWPVSELPNRLKSIGKPLSVRVGFPIMLTATDNTLVWTYSGSWPDVLPILYEIHFAGAVKFPRPPIVVEGVAVWSGEFVVIREGEVVK
jgi:hypothetical protein